MNRLIEDQLFRTTLVEKNGQMAPLRHFDTIGLAEVSTKFLGSVTHTLDPRSGDNSHEWQIKLMKLQKEVLSTRLGKSLLFSVDAIHGKNHWDDSNKPLYLLGDGLTYHEIDRK